MIPTTIEECYTELDRILSDEVKENIRSLRKEDVVDLHFSIGTHIRNEWKMWEEDSKLVNLFKKENPLVGADEASMLIIEGYWEYLKK